MFKIIEFLIITLFSLERANKTIATPAFVSVPWQGSERSSGQGYQFFLFLLLGFITVPKVWFSLFCLINKNNPQQLMSLNTISYTVYNCPNTKKYRVNKMHIGRAEAEPDMNFIDPIFSVLGQLYTV